MREKGKMKEEESGELGRSGEWGHPHSVDCPAPTYCRRPHHGTPVFLLSISGGLVLLVFDIKGVSSV